MRYQIAIASTDGKIVNQHYGKADTFHIVEADSDNMTFKYKEARRVKPVCQGGDHNEKNLEESATKLSDCTYVLVSRVGYRAQNVLGQVGIEVYELPGVIEDSVKKLFAYIEIQKLL